MTARNQYGQRWFAVTPPELMDQWLEDPELLDWFARAVELCEAKAEPAWVAGLGWCAAPSLREQTTDAHLALLRDVLEGVVSSCLRRELSRVS